MRRYVLRRILLILPVLAAMVFTTFMISRQAPGDPVFLSFNAPGATLGGVDRQGAEKLYRYHSHELGFDLPTFYFSLSPLSYPDTLHRITYLDEREALTEITTRTGNWDAVSRYFNAIQDLREAAFSLTTAPEVQRDADELRANLQQLSRMAKPSDIAYLHNAIDSLMILRDTVFSSLKPLHARLIKANLALENEATPWRSYIPSLRWHGLSNQFHFWLMNVLRFDFGKSYIDRRPVQDRILECLPVSLIMGVTGYLLSYFLATWAGLFAVRHRNRWPDHLSGYVIFFLYSIPTFVLGMLAIIFLSGPSGLQIFPVSGLSTDGAEQWPAGYRFMDYLYHLTLPTLVFSVHIIAMLSRQMRIAMIDVMDSDYIRTARAKGLREQSINRRHALPNAFLPLIYAISHHIPALVTGALVVEGIFSLPGMGNLVFEALLSSDHPTLVAIFGLVGLLTIFGSLAGDILYALADPRITFSTQ